ncbi:MAG: dicarboxylate/amino acid:cation symporter [Sedimentisphaerales bacterium]|nr:dicarboxylate/amino acid:cation symporter [Sedimentisphaerales bacterium]
MRGRLHWLIFIGMLAGVLLGLILSRMGATPAQQRTIAVLDLFGQTLFIGALKMIVAPLIFFSILSAITSLASAGRIWNLGGKTLVYYLATTSVAVAIGLILVLTIRPGHTARRDEIRQHWQEQKVTLQQRYGEQEEKIAQAERQGALELLRRNLERVIMNPFASLAENQSLGIIFFAIVLGIAIVAVGPAAQPVVPVIGAINAAIMKLTGWIMAGSPFFILCLIASLVGSLGAGVFETLLWYVLTVLLGIAAHVAVLLGLCRVLGNCSPLRFLRGIRQAWMVAFATRSSAATLPVTIHCVQDNLEVSPTTAKFVLPLGATINMDGTALYEGVAVLFLIQLFGGMPGAEITLSPVLTMVIFLTAVLASIGAAAVPDAGLVTMVLVAQAVGLSVEYIPMIFAVDALLDMFRTSTNVLGDSVGSVIIDRWTRNRKQPSTREP